MRFNLRIKIRNTTFFAMISQTQTVSGITSLVKNVKSVKDNLHMLFWDLEDCVLMGVINELARIQDKYDLGEIYIYGDSKQGKTFNAVCFTPTKFARYLKILIDTYHVDYLFYKYTVMRGKATIRLTNKKNRKEHKLLYTIKGRKERIPELMESVIYDTGLMKGGRTLELVK